LKRLGPVGGGAALLLFAGLVGVSWRPESPVAVLTLVVGVIGVLIAVRHGAAEEIGADLGAEVLAELAAIERSGRRLLWLVIFTVAGCLSPFWLPNLSAGWADIAAAGCTLLLLVVAGLVLLLRRRYFRILDTPRG
jgi:hypothetical protein